MPARKPAKNAAAPRTTRQIGRYIVADPRVCHGKLTFRGTRLFVSDVLEQVERGLPWDAIVEEWEGGVPHEAIAEAVRLARESFLEHAAEYSGPAGTGEQGDSARRELAAQPAGVSRSAASARPQGRGKLGPRGNDRRRDLDGVAQCAPDHIFHPRCGLLD